MAVAAAALSSKLTAAAAVAGQSYVVVAGLRKHVGANGSKLEIQMTCGKRTVSRVFESCTHQHTLSSAQLNVLSSVDDDDSDDEFGNLRENEPWDESLCFACVAQRGTKIYVCTHTYTS